MKSKLEVRSWNPWRKFEKEETPSRHGRQGFELLTSNFDLCTGAVTLRVIGISEILGELVVMFARCNVG